MLARYICRLNGKMLSHQSSLRPRLPHHANTLMLA
jgi:hypothetical protein